MDLSTYKPKTNLNKMRHVFRRNKSDKTIKKLSQELKELTGSDNCRYLRVPSNKSVYTETYKNVRYLVKNTKVINLGREYTQKTVFFTDK